MSTTNTVNKKSTKASSKKAQEETQVVASTPATVSTTTVEVAVAPVATPAKTQKKRTAKVEETPVATETVQAQSQEETPVVESAPQVENAQTEEETKYASFEEVMKAIAECDKIVVQKQRERVQLIRIAQKYHAQVVRQVKKKSRSDNKSTKRAVSGFNKPAPVPAAFCGYLGLSEGQELPRTAVTALLYQKIKELNLLNPEDKREIQADAPLRELFRMEDGEVIKFNNFQKFVSRVYKGESSDESSEEEASA